MTVTRKPPAPADRAIARVQLAQAGEDALSENTKAVISGSVVEEDGTLDGGEGVVDGEAVEKKYDTITLNGEKFRLREQVGAMAMFKWAAAADMDTDDPRALAAIYAMLKSVVFKEDWRKFEDHALDTDAGPEELLSVITDGLELVAGRPTGEPSGS